ERSSFPLKTVRSGMTTKEKKSTRVWERVVMTSRARRAGVWTEGVGKARVDMGRGSCRRRGVPRVAEWQSGRVGRQWHRNPGVFWSAGPKHGGAGRRTKRRVAMAKYLIQTSYTTEGVKGLAREGGTGRRKAAEAMLAKLDGRLEAFYFAFGDH